MIVVFSPLFSDKGVEGTRLLSRCHRKSKISGPNGNDDDNDDDDNDDDDNDDDDNGDDFNYFQGFSRSLLAGTTMRFAPFAGRRWDDHHHDIISLSS